MSPGWATIHAAAAASKPLTLEQVAVVTECLDNSDRLYRTRGKGCSRKSPCEVRGQQTLAMGVCNVLLVFAWADNTGRLDAAATTWMLRGSIAESCATCT